MIISVSAIIPTANRSSVLSETLASIAAQSVQPAEIIIVDASETSFGSISEKKYFTGLKSNLINLRADFKGAAAQRNQGIMKAIHPFILFMDDDIILEPDCLKRLWEAVNIDDQIGAVNALIINQQYLQPGWMTRMMYKFMSGEKLSSYAGKCIGPAWNLLPEDRGDIMNKVEWLNTTCTMYRKSVLPVPCFQPHFKDYSLMEDLALSLEVAKKYKLFNIRNARIFHNSQPGDHKSSTFSLSRMEVENRYYVMTKVMGRIGFVNIFKLILFECWGILTLLAGKKGIFRFLPAMAGRCSGFFNIIFK